MNNLYRKAAIGASLAAASIGSAFAQASDPGVTAITDLSAKATSYTTAAFGVAVLVAGAFWGIRMMKKSFGAAK
jgi:Phage major coat protein, Gp8